MVTLGSALRRRSGYQVAVGSLVVAAWTVLVIWAASPYAGFLDHRSLGEHHLPLALLLPLFLLGWTLMTLAMMLPASIDALRSFAYSTPRGRNPGLELASFTTGYVLVWLAFGVGLYLGDSLLHEAVEAGAVPAAVTDLLLAGVLLAAGLYQLTPIKRSFLRQCLAASRAGSVHNDAHRDVSGRRPPVLDGVRHGFICLGSCWGLMLVMFALGGVQPGWMLALTAVMALESAGPTGARLQVPLGLALIACALLTAPP